MSVYILGISAYYHDSAAALLCDGRIIAAAQEERFTRRKHDAGFPAHAIAYCMRESGKSLMDIDAIVFYDKPLAKFDRLLETYLAYAPRGITSFVASMPTWIKEKVFLKSILKKHLAELAGCKRSLLPKLLFTEHHRAHAASAFFASPFNSAAVLCLDGVGEWATTTAWAGQGNRLVPKWQIDFPHSLGLLYSAFTFFTGFKVNSGEYKLMGLAPYGEPKYVDIILKNLIDLKDDGSFRLNMKYFDFATGLTMTNKRMDKLFDGPRRLQEGILTQREMDIARSIQVVTEEVVLRLCRTLHEETKEDNLCLAGGVALNCVANGRIQREGPYKDMWIQPAAGDAGGSLGAALAVWHEYFGNERNGNGSDIMCGSYLGPQFSNDEIQSYLDSIGARYERLEDDALLSRVVNYIDSEKVIGWFNGRMEFGPRALGSRSIIGDARSSKMQSVMNLKIKYRESFRPFAPSVIAEKVFEYFDLDISSPYMLIVAPVKQKHRIQMTEKQCQLFGIEKLNVKRSQVPAITHVDYSARVQTVHRETNPRYYELLKRFDEKTGCGVIINTSFNVRGEPIVCTPEDAYRCFMRTGMDYLVMENYLISKVDQSGINEDSSWKSEYELD